MNVESSVKQKYEEAHEVETSASDFQQQISAVGHFIMGRKSGQYYFQITNHGGVIMGKKKPVRKNQVVPIAYIEGKTRNTIQWIEIPTEQYKAQCNNTVGTQCLHRVSLHDGHNRDTEGTQGHRGQMETPHYLRWRSTPGNETHIGVLVICQCQVSGNISVISDLAKYV